MASTVRCNSTATEDPGTAFHLLLSCPSVRPPSQIWDQRLQKNPSLYNGTKFRYGGFSLSDPSTIGTDCSICLNLGLTDYRTFVGTNLNPLWEKFLVSSEDDTVKCQHMANPLGNGAIVETSDKKILVLQRSHNVGEFPGYYVFPGGHSEPQEIGISSHLTDSDSSSLAALNDVVSKEMFDGIVREVIEEIGAPADSLTVPEFIGVSQRTMNVRPTAFFFVRCNLDSTKIHELYSEAIISGNVHLPSQPVSKKLCKGGSVNFEAYDLGTNQWLNVTISLTSLPTIYIHITPISGPVAPIPPPVPPVPPPVPDYTPSSPDYTPTAEGYIPGDIDSWLNLAQPSGSNFNPAPGNSNGWLDD